MKQSSVELGLSGRYDADGDDVTTAFLELTLGYYLYDGFEAGLNILDGTTATGRRDSLGIFAEYDQDISMPFVPGGGILFSHRAPPRGADAKDGRAFGLFGVLSLPIADNAALALKYLMEFSDEAVLGDGDFKRRNRELNLALRLFF